MAGAISPIFTDIANNGVQQFTSADTTTKKTLFTPGADGGRVDRILVTSNDTAAITFLFYVTVSAVDYHIGDVVVAIGAGYDAVAAQDALPTLLRNLSLQNGLTLPTGHVLKAACKVTMTAAKTADIISVGGDY